jgi:hypothetical protein
MEFEGIIYNKSNRVYKFLGYFGFFFYFQIFSMIFFSHYYSEMDLELLEFTGQNYPQIKGGRLVLYSSDGSNNKVLIRTKDIELKRKFFDSQ